MGWKLPEVLPRMTVRNPMATSRKAAKVHPRGFVVRHTSSAVDKQPAIEGKLAAE